MAVQRGSAVMHSQSIVVENLDSEVIMKGFRRVALLLASAVGICWSSIANAGEEDFSKDSYVESVIGVLHAHADAIENLNTHRIKYSNNLVRHAAALEHTFGLLGPMDWHAAQSVTLMMEQGKGSEEENHEKFDQLQKRATASLKGVVIAARRTLEEDDHQALAEALAKMKEACNNCHTYLPEDVAPNIWGDLDRK
jgi:hypothetical protein